VLHLPSAWGAVIAVTQLVLTGTANLTTYHTSHSQVRDLLLVLEIQADIAEDMVKVTGTLSNIRNVGQDTITNYEEDSFKEDVRTPGKENKLTIQKMTTMLTTACL